MSGLVLDGIFYTYPGQVTPVIEDLSARLEPGELVILTGTNGSGKSTLARLIAGLLEPQRGRITGRRDESGWNGVAMILQDPGSQMVTDSAEAEIAWGLENLAIDRTSMGERVEAALQKFGLNHLRNIPPESLSDGERQLVAVAAVMVMEPDIMIFDEATAYLDLYWRRRVWEAALEATKRCSVIWITTRLEGFAEGRKVWKMEGGKLM